MKKVESIDINDGSGNSLPPEQRLSRPKVCINTNVVLTKAQARATYVWTKKYRNGKPVFWVPSRRIISAKSAFEHKKLCDGPTFTLGLACYFSCLFCYVWGQLSRNASVLRILKETGLTFDQIAIERDNPLPFLQGEVIGKDGRPKFRDPNDRRVIFASPLVDVAANLPAAQATIAACKIILKNTYWQIRLLSKSAFLQTVAEGLADYQDRVIYGLSTGTFEDPLAQIFELRASTPTARLRTLHWLQDHGYRTFAMICPVLPQDDYHKFAAAAVRQVRADRCEHVWAEVLNVRGRSLVQTCAGLRQSGFEDEAQRLERVSGPKNKSAWEAYARAIFQAMSEVVPPQKLRFLQYVQAGQVGWWRQRQRFGALLLGAHAQDISLKSKAGQIDHPQAGGRRKYAASENKPTRSRRSFK